jgi:CubicO group peptidase (beta-lactamase class C family)
VQKIKAALGAGILLLSMIPGSALAANGPQLVPLRAIAETIGAQVNWDGATNTVTVIKGDTTLVVRIGSTEATINGQRVTLAQPVQIVASRALVPSSLLSEALGIANPLNVQVHYEGALEKAIFQPDWAPDFETYAQKLFPFAATCPGMAFGVAKDGQELLLRSFGARNCEQSLPMTTDTTMGLGSSTKTFTAVAIMQLQEAGILSVDDLVTKHLPEYRTKNPEDAKRTTIHHLLTHSAGLPPLPILWNAMATSLDADPFVPPSLKGLKPVETAGQIIDGIVAAPIGQVAEPGKLFSYSNESYALLGEIIQRVSGQSYEAYVNEHILKPAGMVHTAWDDQTMNTFPEYATLYTMVPKSDAPGGVGALATPVWWNPGVMNAAGGLRSTVQDVLRFTEIFRNGGLVGETRLLSAASVKEMTTPQIQAETGTSYGYGVMIKQVGGLTVLEHGGANKGTAAIWSVIPSLGLSGVGLSNVGGLPSEMILQGALNLAAGLPVSAGSERRPTVAVDAQKLAAYAGSYAGGEAAPATFTVENGALVFNQAGQKFPTRAVGQDQFAVNLGGPELNVRFIADESGHYYAISIGLRIWSKL